MPPCLTHLLGTCSAKSVEYTQPLSKPHTLKYETGQGQEVGHFGFKFRVYINSVASTAGELSAAVCTQFNFARIKTKVLQMSSQACKSPPTRVV